MKLYHLLIVGGAIVYTASVILDLNYGFPGELSASVLVLGILMYLGENQQ